MNKILKKEEEKKKHRLFKIQHTFLGHCLHNREVLTELVFVVIIWRNANHHHPGHCFQYNEALCALASLCNAEMLSKSSIRGRFA